MPSKQNAIPIADWKRPENYRGAVLLPAADVRQQIQNGSFDISDALLTNDAHKRLMLGFQVTPHVPIGVYEFLAGGGFLPTMP